MKLIDPVYGEEEIDEEVLIELINSKPVQRLKKLNQWGIPKEYYHKNSFSRYDHSIGVLILLKKFGASLNEQIAGLLHDVSHTAFSHVADWVLGDPTKEDYQDQVYAEFILKSNIPAILHKYNINPEEIICLDKFSLLEKSAPNLCADRIDYTLRELIQTENKEEIDNFLSNLIVLNEEFVLKETSLAYSFAKKYSNLQKEHWASDEARARYYLLSSAIKSALNNGFISSKELIEGTDDLLIEKLFNTNNSFILENLYLLKSGFKIQESEDGIQLLKKFRYIDPKILTNEGVQRLSQVSKDYLELLNLNINENNKIKKIKILKK